MGRVYKLEQHLKEICTEAPEYGDLLATWNINKKSYTEALKPIMQNYAHYTEHGEAHSETILANIELFLGEDQIRKLSPTDTWLLLQAAYLHDLGMSLMYTDIEKEWEGEEFQRYLKELETSDDPFLRESAGYLKKLPENLKDPEFEKRWPLQIRRYTAVIISDYYRRVHGKLSRDYICDMQKKWGISLEFNGLIQYRLIHLLGTVAYLHTQNSEDVLKLDYIANGHNADYIHPRFIAEMIRIGDLLDADNNRHNPYLHKAIGDFPESSKNHVKKHNSTRHILITPDLVEFRADCGNAEIYRETRNFITWLVEEMSFLNREWLAIVPKEFTGHAPRLGKTEILLNGKPDLNGVTDLRFQISQEKAFDVIEGSNLYEDRYIFIREIIQNAIDASKIQLWRDLVNGKYAAWMGHSVIDRDLMPFEVDSKIFDNYKVIVKMKNVGQNEIEVVVSDNGTGMSVDALKKMCEVGTSYHGREKLRREIENMPAWLRPTAGFGIGLQSVFLATDKFDIISRSENEEIHAMVESRKQNGYVQISASETGRKQGTDVIIRLKKPENYRISLEGFTNFYIQEEYDPFGRKNLTLQYRILDLITGNCERSFFPIIVYVEETRAWAAESAGFESEVQEWEKEEQYYYKISEDLTEMQVWDIPSHTFVKMELNFTRLREFFFKGIKVSCSEYIGSEGISTYLDIYGLETKESLSLNRKKLTDSARMTVSRIICKATGFFRKKIYDKFCCISDTVFDEQWGIEDRDNKLIALWVISDVSCRSRLIKDYRNRFKSIQTYFSVLFVNKKEGVVAAKEEAFYDIASNLEKVSYLNQSDLFSYAELQNRRLITIRKICEENMDRIGREYIILSANFTKYIKKYEIDKVTVLQGENTLVLFDIGTSGTAWYYKADDSVRKYLLRFLAETPAFCCKYNWGAERRKAIPVHEKYQELAVNYLQFGISSMAFPHTASLISPILPEDKESCSRMEKDLWIRSILQREDFSKLADYVCENQVEKGKYTKDMIMEKYRELLDDYYLAVNQGQ